MSVLEADGSVRGKLPAFVEAERFGQMHLDIAIVEAINGRRRKLGWVEFELRQPSAVLTSRAHRVWAGARASLRRLGMEPGQLDIASEAIEAAEALGL